MIAGTDAGIVHQLPLDSVPAGEADPLEGIRALFPHSLESFTQLEQLIDFYVKEHNVKMPHHALHGQTPDEVYFDQADRVRDRLATARHRARRARMEANRGESCHACALPTQQTMSVITAVANALP